ncbi:MAG: DUF3324 domain-containing protein [Schleiferilactobacillus harbinensis]|jgi:hypothetical protein|nr:DUF3324 domain-containing protein [Schleiferilactobacillus harbinensis]MCI1912606.1 DUF3324 domain-containing protein [Schleiferilactobacillus harbinensis]
MMKKRMVTFILMFGTALVLLFLATPAAVDAADITAVTILDAADQKEIPDTLTIGPGEKRQFILRVVNGDQNIQANITKFPVLTSDQGQLNDKQSGDRQILDGALNFANLVAQLPDKPVPMAAGETKDIPFTVSVPESQTTTELVLGTISVSVANVNNLIGRPGNGIDTSLNIKTGDGHLPTARAVFTQAHAGEYQGRDGVLVDVANHVGNIAQVQAVTGEIRAVDQAAAPRRRVLRTVEIAPHSNFTFFIPNAELKMGQYAVTMTARNGKKVLVQSKFSISVNRRLATATSKQERTAQALIRRWLLIVAVSGLIVIAGIFIVLHWRHSAKGVNA